MWQPACLRALHRLRLGERAESTLWLEPASVAGLQELLHRWPQFFPARCLLAAATHMAADRAQADSLLRRAAVDLEGWSLGRTHLLSTAGAQATGADGSLTPQAREGALEAMQRWWPHEPLFPAVRGLLLMERGALEEAIVAATRAVHLAPQAYNPSFFLAQIYQRAGRDAEAEPLYATLVQRCPHFAQARLLHAEVLERLSRQRERIATLVPLVQTSANFAVYWQLADAHEKLDELEQSLTWLQRAQHLRPQDSATLAGMGYLCTGMGRYAQALTYYERALASEPGDDVLQLNRGVCLHGLGRVEDALQAFAALLGCRPSDPRAHFWSARCHETLGDVAAAEDAYREALRADPGMVEAARRLILALLAQHRNAEVLALMRDVTCDGPDSAPLWAQASVVADALGETDTSCQYIERALAADPDFLPAWILYVCHTARLGPFAAHLRALRRVCELQPTLQAHLELASALREADDAAGALEVVTRGLVSDPAAEDGLLRSAHDLQAVCLRDVGRLPDASAAPGGTRARGPDNGCVGAVLAAASAGDERA